MIKIYMINGTLFWIVMVKETVRRFTSGKKTKIFDISRKKSAEIH